MTRGLDAVFAKRIPFDPLLWLTGFDPYAAFASAKGSTDWRRPPLIEHTRE